MVIKKSACQTAGFLYVGGTTLNYLRELGILLGICVLGDVVSKLIGNVLPGNVLGMILLLVLLVTRLVKCRQVEHAADFFLKNMAIFFLPVSLGILDLYAELKSQLAAILAICLLTTFITALATAATVHLVLRLQERARAKKQPQAETVAVMNEQEVQQDA